MSGLESTWQKKKMDEDLKVKKLEVDCEKVDRIWSR
jgi:hypothetical protein